MTIEHSQPSGLADRSRSSRNGAASLARLRDDFPGYRIWGEVTGCGLRFIARRGGPGRGPHTLVAADLDEIREALVGHTTGQCATGS